ncbi:hypothetical protein CDAR_556861 [Caerostris darwini]|uniref:Uncharacterized protein n=1 Tax=Caerostris darwini TaxID=1538125 RepID=A0AAV4QJB4_9ARAC|nr:hypothetical protein CDAR_556861 [Caerostris darwini]
MRMGRRSFGRYKNLKEETFKQPFFCSFCFSRCPIDVASSRRSAAERGGHIPIRRRLPAEVFSWERGLLQRSLHLLPPAHIPLRI